MTSEHITLGKRDFPIPALSPKCDVVVVNYNAGPLLAQCIASLLDEPVQSIIVVDNASTDDSLAYLETHCHDRRLTIIRNSKNLGFSVGCNIGTCASIAPHILYLNPDSQVEPGALRKLLDVVDSASDIGMAGGFLCNPDGSEQPGGRRVFPTPRRALIRAFGLSFLGKLFPRYFSDFLLFREPLPLGPVDVEAISGACMMVKRDAIQQVGLWDEGYFLHCEDLDWCMRFRQNGQRVMFVPDARIMHWWRACSQSRPIFVEWHKHHGMLRFYRKFFRDQYPGALWALVTVGVWVRFALIATYSTLRKAKLVFRNGHA